MCTKKYGIVFNDEMIPYLLSPLLWILLLNHALTNKTYSPVPYGLWLTSTVHTQRIQQNSFLANLGECFSFLSKSHEFVTPSGAKRNFKQAVEQLPERT
jgi:hypothetical protein